MHSPEPPTEFMSGCWGLVGWACCCCLNSQHREFVSNLLHTFSMHLNGVDAKSRIQLFTQDKLTTSNYTWIYNALVTAGFLKPIASIVFTIRCPPCRHAAEPTDQSRPVSSSSVPRLWERRFGLLFDFLQNSLMPDCLISQLQLQTLEMCCSSLLLEKQK